MIKISPRLLPTLNLMRERITAEDLLHFLKQLTTLISAGISLMQSLDLLAKSQENSKLQFLIQTLRLGLENGKEFHQGLQRFPHHFDLFSCQLVRIGEKTGSLVSMLKRLSTYKEKQLTLQRQLQQALIYPAIILASALITTLCLLLFIVPHFAHLYEHLPNKIPALTQGLINLSLGLHKYGIWLVFALPSLILGFYHLKKDQGFIEACQQQLASLPYLHKILKKILLARFARNLSTTLACSIPLTEALIMVSLLFRQSSFTQNIQQLYTGVQAGNRFYSTLSLNAFFPSLLVQMVKTGEESGTLEGMLEQFALLYETDVERLAQSFNQVLPPLIIAILGVLIGVIVIAMYLPIFHLGTVI